MKSKVFINNGQVIGSGRSTASRITAAFILAVMAWTMLPLAALGQDPGDPQHTQGTVPVGTANGFDKIASKMSYNSFSELSAMSPATAKSANAGDTGDIVYAVLNVEFKTPIARRALFNDLKKSTIPNAFVLTVVDQFADIFVSTQQAWTAVSNNPDVLKADEQGRFSVPPPPEGTVSGLQSQAVPESIIRGGYKGLTGKNVNVAILDTGIDFRHPDFATTDSSGKVVSRLKYFWDTSLEYKPGRGTPAPFKYPNGTSIGTLFTKEQLTAELRSSTVSIPPTDADGHGTACASIAAGNGNADKLPGGLNRAAVNGVAPNADIIGVRMGPADNSFRNSFMLGAITEWLDKIAGAQPLVMSGSFGGHYTGHDGQTVAERQLDARFPMNKVGRAIVFAAGNEGAERIHAKVSFAGENKIVTWKAAREAIINVYFSSGENYLLYGTVARPLTKENTMIKLDPITRQYHAQVTVPAGEGTLWLKNALGHPSEADLYFYNNQVGEFTPESASYSNLIGTPGTTGNAITIGSYDWNDGFHTSGKQSTFTDSCGKSIEIGWLSCYSSPGPRRASAAGPAVVKPEIVSPGQYYTSANARINGASAGWGAYAGYTDSTGYYRRMNGTSAATPYTAGVIALLFEKRPALTLGRVRDLLKMNASKTGLSPFATSLPNNNWGYGKLDLVAIDRILTALDAK